MGTEDETELTMSRRATAAAGAALVAACIVNPLDVIKTRIQAQGMAEAAGQQACHAPWNCTSTLFEQPMPHDLQHTHGLSADCQQHAHAGSMRVRRNWFPQRNAHTLTPEAVWGAHAHNSSSSVGQRLVAGRLHAMTPASSSSTTVAAAAAAAMSVVRKVAANRAAAAAAAASAGFRRWGITEGPLPIRRTPPGPLPAGWMPAPFPSTAAAAEFIPAGLAAGAGSSCHCTPQSTWVVSNSMWEMAKQIRAKEGLRVLWRGTWASLLIAVPMVGIYMPLYDTLLESWSTKLGSLAPVISGTAARTAACFCVAPFELVRTRLQASAAAGVSMRSTLSHLLADQRPALSASQQLTTQARAAGVLSTAAVLQPVVQHQPQVRAASVLRAVPRMWTGFSATLVRDVPFSAMYWALVEPLRRAMLPVNSHWAPLQQLDNMLHQQQHIRRSLDVASSSRGNGHDAATAQQPVQQQQHNVHHSQLEILIANMVSGFVAGGLAAGATTPFDVVKTRMQIATPDQLQGQRGGGGVRVFNILKGVYQKEGMEGLFAGLKPRAARAAPACAIVISVYELLKSYLTPA